MDWQKVFLQAGSGLLFMAAAQVVVGDTGRAVFLWLSFVFFLGCSLGIHVMKDGR